MKRTLIIAYIVIGVLSLGPIYLSRRADYRAHPSPNIVRGGDLACICAIEALVVAPFWPAYWATVVAEKIEAGEAGK